MPEADAGSLAADAARLGVVLDTAQAERLLAFGSLLARANRAFNLISRRDVHRLVPRHLLDSLSVAPWLVGERVLDMGTGAGLPGVPLAIAREEVQFTLIDLSERKIRFVDRAARALGLDNVTSQCADVRHLDAADTYDTVVCRAVGDAAAVWELAARRLSPEGRMVVMSRTRGEAGAGPALPAGAALEAAQRIEVPGLDGAHELLLLRHTGREET